MKGCLSVLNLKICLVYLDDVIVSGSTFKETLARLQTVLKRLSEFGLKLKVSKCKFFYIEHPTWVVLSPPWVCSWPDKITALQEWLQHPPKSFPELQTFHSFSGYYRSFGSGFAKIAKHPHQLVAQQSKKQSLRRGQFHFETHISKLSLTPVLAYSDSSSSFVLHTDASGESFDAALYQNQYGQTRGITFENRTLNDAERKFSAYRREFFVFKWAVTETLYLPEWTQVPRSYWQ